MKLASFEAIVKAFDEADVRYIVAGGLAVNAHGFLRATKDADFVIQLIPENTNKTFSALESIGYRPRVPITAEQFASIEMRESWGATRECRCSSSGATSTARRRLMFRVRALSLRGRISSRPDQTSGRH